MGKLLNLWVKIKQLFRRPPAKPNSPILNRIEGEQMKKYIYVFTLPELAKGYVVTRELKFSGHGTVQMLQPYEKVVNLAKDATEFKIVLPYSYSIIVELTDIDVHGQRSEPSQPLFINTEMAPRPAKPGNLMYEVIEEDSIEEEVIHTHCQEYPCEKIHEHCQDHVHCEYSPCEAEHDHCDENCKDVHASDDCCGSCGCH